MKEIWALPHTETRLKLGKFFYLSLKRISCFSIDIFLYWDLEKIRRNFELFYTSLYWTIQKFPTFQYHPLSDVRYDLVLDPRKQEREEGDKEECRKEEIEEIIERYQFFELLFETIESLCKLIRGSPATHALWIRVHKFLQICLLFHYHLHFVPCVLFFFSFLHFSYFSFSLFTCWSEF